MDAGLFETDDARWVAAGMATELREFVHRPDDVGPRTLADIGVVLCDAWGGLER